MIATSSLFIVGTRITLRCLEVMPAVGKAAVSENTRSNLLGLNVRKWWRRANCKPGAGVRRMGRGMTCRRHDGEENGGD
jgi:hypothetical protein